MLQIRIPLWGVKSAFEAIFFLIIRDKVVVYAIQFDAHLFLHKSFFESARLGKRAVYNTFIPKPLEEAIHLTTNINWGLTYASCPYASRAILYQLLIHYEITYNPTFAPETSVVPSFDISRPFFVYEDVAIPNH